MQYANLKDFATFILRAVKEALVSLAVGVLGMAAILSALVEAIKGELPVIIAFMGIVAVGVVIFTKIKGTRDFLREELQRCNRV
jgi:hypothetical protein